MVQRIAALLKAPPAIFDGTPANPTEEAVLAAHAQYVAEGCDGIIGLGGGPLFVGWLSDMLAPLHGQDSLGMAMRAVLLVGAPAAFLSLLASRTCADDFARCQGWSPGTPALATLH